LWRSNQLFFPAATGLSRGRFSPKDRLALRIVVPARVVTNFVVFSFLQQGLLLSVTVSQLATTAVLALLNFTVYQRLVFHEKT